MDASDFVVIGENIHCTRIVKVGGRHTVELEGGGVGIPFHFEDADRMLPVPDGWAERSPAFGDGKLKHIALALWLALNGSGSDARAGYDYLLYAAGRQIEAGAHYLDVNVDEYSNDPTERAEAMRWLAELLSDAYDVPLSVDSSSEETMLAGLEGARKETCPSMVNSVSLEREQYVELIADFDAAAVVSPAGREDLPTDVEGRLANFEQIVARLDAAGIGRERMYLDPLVFPVSTDPQHGRNFLAATEQALRRFEGVRLSGGFSNVSFGMPRRKLLNMVFVRLAAEAGARSGIIDPTSMPVEEIAALDENSQPFRLARAFLLGEDMYGMEFLAAHRDGRLDA